MTTNDPENAKLAFTVDETCEALGIKRTTFYKLAASNQIVVFKICGRRLADARSVRALVERAIELEPRRISAFVRTL
jgi:excisionase family DNA binding protein